MKQSQAIRKERYPVGNIQDKRNNTPTAEQRKQNLRRLRIEAHQAEIRAKQSEIWFD